MLLAHWPLDGHARDLVGGRHGTARRVQFVRTGDGGSRQCGWFNGIDARIDIADDAAWHFGAGEFTLSAWMRLPADSYPFADLISKFDPAARKGFHLAAGGAASGYSALGDAHGVGFGVDNDIRGPWTDCGKPRDDNTLISGLIVYKQQLYAGIADALTDDGACRVYRYEGGRTWTDVGRLGTDPLTRSVMSFTVHRGELYAGTGTWDWDVSLAKKGGANRVFRYAGGETWLDCGAFGGGQRVFCLASWQGDLYAGDDDGCCYRYAGGMTWEYCGRLGNDRIFNSMTVWRDRLYGASHGNIYQYEGGTTWALIGDHPFDITQIHKLQVYRGELLVGTWPQGYILRYAGAGQWENTGLVGIDPAHGINEINDLFVYNGQCYAGVIPKAEVYRYDGPDRWKNIGQLVDNADWSVDDIVSWCRIPCFAAYRDRLYAGTSTCHGRASAQPDPNVGKVFSLEAGKTVLYGDDVGPDWTHVAAVRRRDKLQLYINGALVGETGGLDAHHFDVSNGAPLTIGAGEHHYFKGHARDVRLYGAALDPRQIGGEYAGGLRG